MDSKKCRFAPKQGCLLTRNCPISCPDNTFHERLVGPSGQVYYKKEDESYTKYKVK